MDVVALPPEFAVVALIVSGVVSIILTLIFRIVLRKNGSNFWDCIREKDFHPSLARFQFLLWTWVIVFAFFSVILMRAFAGVQPVPLAIPQNLLLLMGVNAAPTAISSAVNGFRYQAFITSIEKQRRANNVNSTRQLLELKDKSGNQKEISIEVGATKYILKEIPLSDIFNEEGKPAITRFQVFVWTIIAIIVYFIIFGMTTLSSLPNIQSFSLPDVDLTMLTLMGLSHGTYIAGKMAKST